MGANFAELAISQSQNNYNTASHKGLQSYYSMPATNDPPIDPSAKWPASEPLLLPTGETVSTTIKAKQSAKPQDPIYRHATGELTIKAILQPNLKQTDSSLRGSNSQSAQLVPGAVLSEDERWLSVEDLMSRMTNLSPKPVSVAEAPKPHRISDPIPNPKDPTINPAGSSEDNSIVSQPSKNPIDLLSITQQELPPSVDLRTKDSYSHRPIERAIATEPRHREENPLIEAAHKDNTQVTKRRFKQTSKDCHSVPAKMIREVGQITEVQAPADPSPAAWQQGQLIEGYSALSSSKASGTNQLPPATLAERESLSASEILAILDSHHVPLPEYFNKKQLRDILNQTFPISVDNFTSDDRLGSLPLGWESRISRDGKKYFYNSINNTSTWENPLNISLVRPGELHPELILSPQKLNELQVPPSRPRQIEAGKQHPTKLPEGWEAEYVTFNEGRLDGW